MWPNPQETADLVTFTEEILTGKLHFLCSVTWLHYIFSSVYYIKNSYKILMTNWLKKKIMSMKIIQVLIATLPTTSMNQDDIHKPILIYGYPFGGILKENLLKIQSCKLKKHW